MATPERILVTGGGGFIGAALVRALLAQGNEVHLLARSIAAPERLGDLHAACVTHLADISDAASVRRAVRESRPDVVFHLAAAGVAPGQSDRSTILRTNVLGTSHLLDALRHRDYRAFVHAGTGAEYGACGEAIAEDAALTPLSDYAVAKAAASLLCLAEARRKERPAVVVRIFSAYGPGEARQRLIPYVLDCCMRGEVPRINTAAQQRDFIFVDDVVELLRTASAMGGTAGQVLHAGTGRDYSVQEVVETTLEVCGRSVCPVYGVELLRPGEPYRYLANILRTTVLTGWRPQVDLRSGIERTWQWFRSTHTGPMRQAV
jgi:nucleoside-diphosphate-sugar epimerase